MNKQEFLEQLGKRLPQADREERLNFYGEMIDDRMEDGLSEEEAVCAVGSVENILAETAQPQKTPPSKKTRKWLIIAAALILIGGFFLGGAMGMLEWDFGKLSTIEYETNEYTLQGVYKDIHVEAETADITFVCSQDEDTKVICYEEKNAKHIVIAENDALTIRVQNNKKWYEYFDIFFDTPKIKVYIPAGEYGDLTINADTGAVEIPADFTFTSMNIQESTGKIVNCATVVGDMKLKTSTGNITVEKAYAGAMELAVSTGKVIVQDIACRGEVTVNVSTGDAGLTNVKCKSFTSKGDTGDLTLNSVIAEETLSIERSTGDVDFESCDAAEITVITDTGHIKGSLLSDKVFIVETDTGWIDVPHTITGGKCQLTTDTGNIKITIG